MLLEGLVRRGHRCAAVTPAVAPSAGPTTEDELRDEMARRGIALSAPAAGFYRYRHRGVEVDAVAGDLRRHAEDRIRELDPDWVLVNDDKLRVLLGAALAAAPARVVLVLQTVTNMPFGPLAAAPDRAQADAMRRSRSAVAISRFLQQYLVAHGDLESVVLRLPVHGEGPFDVVAPDGAGFVTMLNPCREKGVDIFLALARKLRDQEFAAVRGWGTDGEVVHLLAREPNVRVLEPADELDAVLGETRVLLAPSIWPETFGYVVPEAMLRGIPVLASTVGGLPEAGLGLAELLPPAADDVAPWAAALRRLLADGEEYARRSERGREAALAYVDTTGPERFEAFLASL